MSATNNKAPDSIFDSQDSNDLKERQKLEELKRQAKVQQVKLDKRLNKQKIMMGAFLGQVLASKGDDEKMIQDYFAMNFPDFLTRKSDKELFKSMIESLGGDMGLGEEKDSFMVSTSIRNSMSVDEQVKVRDRGVKDNQQPSFDNTTDNSSLDLLSGDENGFSDNQGYRR